MQTTLAIVLLFLASGTLEFVALNILGTLPQTMNGEVLIMVIQERYLEMPGADSTSKSTSAIVANVFLDARTVAYEKPDHLLQTMAFIS